MKYVVYIDVFFAINFFMDFIILLLAKKILKPQTTIIRCFLAALAGAALSCIITVKSFKSVIMQKIFTYGVISSVMAVIGYPIKGIKAYIKCISCIYAVTIALSGIINGLYYFTGVGEFMLRGINIIRFIFITAAAYFITDFSVKYIKNHRAGTRENDIYKVTLVFNGKSLELKGLYDSGNSLAEPIGGKPVHIAQYDKVEPLIKGVSADKTKIRLVPYKALGTDMGILKAIEIDMLKIEIAGEIIEIEKVLIGIYEGTLSQAGLPDWSSSCLLTLRSGRSHTQYRPPSLQ